MKDVILFATVLAPIITALVEVGKRTITFPKNYVPLFSLVIGLVVGAAATPFTDFGLILRLWAGGLAGLSATGLFELALNKREGITKEDL
ncbi:holin [Halobacillus salinarum]|uniref:Holin n=1 Tax=Halobacillus salinarum TaxID=2932257 RepID=A0ABY4EFU6_9BACI|nr:holin [Halobacillus salinarum]UOQ43345.1 holin [Halobacillus salinarum]